jgi:lysophospholipase L1-like esterase
MMSAFDEAQAWRRKQSKSSNQAAHAPGIDDAAIAAKGVGTPYRVLPRSDASGDRGIHLHALSDLTSNHYLLPIMKPILTLALAFLFTSASSRLHAAEPIAVFTPGARILFQGDSITDGNRGRTADPNHILGHGYAFIIAAKYGAAFAPLKLDFMNRGISGNTVLNLQKRWTTDTLDLKPDVLSILIGINDLSHHVPLEQYEQVYDELLTQTKSTYPKVRLVLCEPFALPVGKRKDGWEAWSAGVKARQEVVARLATKHGAALVRFQQVFDAACKVAPAEHWIWDGTHPTYSGHQLMADEWERAVREKWPAP